MVWSNTELLIPPAAFCIGPVLARRKIPRSTNGSGLKGISILQMFITGLYVTIFNSNEVF